MRSTSGFVFSLGSGAISWSIKKQSTVALSRIEAKYKGTVVLACEAVWLKRIFNDLGVPISDPIFLYCDNISIIHLARNPVFHTRTKHIEVHYHFIGERVLDENVNLQNTLAQTYRRSISSPSPWGLTSYGNSRRIGLSTVNHPSLRGRKEQRV